MTDVRSFPAQHARTRRFTLGRPHAFHVAPTGGHALFLRSAAGDDPVNDLWVLDLDDGDERRLTDARTLVADDAELPAEERARRERARETAGGVVAYATDVAVTRAAFALAGKLFTVTLDGAVAELTMPGSVFDPRPDPSGTRIAAVSGGGLHVVDLDGQVRTLAQEDGVRWGEAEFVAAEEMERSRGYWWSPDGTQIVAARVDDREVATWHIADPSTPWSPPTPHRYPAAGTTNATVSLAIFDVTGHGRVDVAWDTTAFEYLAAVTWTDAGPLTLLVQSRDQRRWQVLAVDADTGAARVVREDDDPVWLSLVPGVPAWLPDGRLLMVRDRLETDTTSLVADDEVLTPPDLQVASVVHVDDTAVWLTASTDPVTSQLHRLDLASGRLETVTEQPGIHHAAIGGAGLIVTRASLDEPTTMTEAIRDGRTVAAVTSLAERPIVTPRVELLELGDHGLRAALLRPTDDDGSRPLPVLLDPYGGPHVQQVVHAQQAFATSQWLADQGFAVLVVDGRGTPGRGPAWERAVHGDLATPVLDDQVTALHAAADHEPRLDLGRVAIRGWSFGGYLAALAVLRRPDVFHAGIAGAPVVDWRLYDTHYTERYLGHPDEPPDAYRVSSLVDADSRLVDPAPMRDGQRPPRLLIIHGLADDNVAAAHSLRLSAALLAAGRPHRFLPLSGVTHMTPQEVVAENLLTLQVDFLHETLGQAP